MHDTRVRLSFVILCVTIDQSEKLGNVFKTMVHSNDAYASRCTRVYVYREQIGEQG